ncbi:MAG: polyprenyl synthetase family protein [Chloroflexi bacterium]|nr:polyprenyl synthetase family protein [Chloroflexota bacterium]
MADNAVNSGYLEAIEDALKQALAAPDAALEPLYAMMQYHMGWRDESLATLEAPRGKRLRPLLCLLSCQAAGGDWQQALPAAAAFELIHNYSLIHDDIEDNSSARRHRTTVWKLWGLAQGINTGDAMWSVAKAALYKLKDAGLAADRILAVTAELDTACLRLCEGQFLDIAFETTHASLSDYDLMIAGKTAALLAAAVASGALVAGADEPVVQHYRSFGSELGLAFQMQDDILGIWGDPAVTGKSAADDLLSRKKTYPVLYTMRWEAEHGLDGLAQLYDTPIISGRFLPQALAYLERAGARAATQARVKLSLDITLEELAKASGSQPAVDMLHDLAVSLVQRSF